jgi:hypothetical protein
LTPASVETRALLRLDALQVALGAITHASGSHVQVRNPLRIDVTGDATKTTLRGYLDGELKLSGNDVPGSLTSGKGAVGTYQTAAKFDDIVLTSPP